MNEFSDRPFALGSMFGIRSFRVTPAGQLTGVVHQRPWAAGVNEAVCDGDPFEATVRRLIATTVFGSAETAWYIGKVTTEAAGRVYLVKRPKPTPPPEPEPHTVASLDCRCGFYAYFDTQHNPHHLDGNVLGVVEGFGVVTVGSRGFRASKARVRALILPQESGWLFPGQWDLGRVYGVPIFDSVEAALAEFPLTVPEGTPKHVEAYRVITYTLAPAPSGESPQDRAMRLRRERNTGPAERRGLDGRRRKGRA